MISAKRSSKPPRRGCPGPGGAPEGVGWPWRSAWDRAASPGAPAPTSYPAVFTAFTQNAVGGIGTAGGSLRLFSINITGANKTVTRTDNLNLQIDLTGAAILPPGTYSGTLNIEAVTQ